MENQITIREAVTESDVVLFWEQLYIYFKRDMFPDDDTGLYVFVFEVIKKRDGKKYMRKLC